jgi:hypothetical protein
MTDLLAPSAPRPQPSVEPDGGGAPSWVAAERGACPLCRLEFDDPAEFSHHLGEAHDLHDDEGKATDFGELAVPVLDTAPPLGLAIEELGRPARVYAPPERDRPIGLLAFVILLACTLGSLIVLTARGGDDELVADGSVRTGAPAELELADDASTPGAAPTPTGATARPVTSSSPGSAGTSAGASPAGSSSAGVSSARSPAGAGSGSSGSIGTTTTTTTAAPTTTLPPPGFLAPEATGARVESCQRNKNVWRVTYSWAFSGGTRWEPGTAYTSLGGSRYEHTITAPRRTAVDITTVHVTDTDGGVHDVSLQPSLSTASC